MPLFLIPFALIAGAAGVLYVVVTKARKRDIEFIKRQEARESQLRG
jgi:hypothetical protein